MVLSVEIMVMVIPTMLGVMTAMMATISPFGRIFPGRNLPV